uniref:Putative ligand-gated ion channel n=1 Tax=Ixodes ricinus TaxID=34613 RepID=A0A0K8RD21_IXORI
MHRLLAGCLLACCLQMGLGNHRRLNGALDDPEQLDDLLRTYDRRALPSTHLGTPTKVACEIYIRSFGSINPATMDYEVDLYLRQTWQDDRLTSSKRVPTFRS